MWNTTFQMSSMKPVCDGYSFGDADGRNVVVSGFRGDKLRVTVEEEVSECCEKWRRGYIFGSVNRPGAVYCLNDGLAVRFCPECGKKL